MIMLNHGVSNEWFAVTKLVDVFKALLGVELPTTPVDDKAESSLARNHIVYTCKYVYILYVYIYTHKNVPYNSIYSPSNTYPNKRMHLQIYA